MRLTPVSAARDACTRAHGLTGAHDSLAKWIQRGTQPLGARVPCACCTVLSIAPTILHEKRKSPIAVLLAGMRNAWAGSHEVLTFCECTTTV
eukprot:4233490-Pleurochrysis_carterae.AAC.5